MRSVQIFALAVAACLFAPSAVRADAEPPPLTRRPVPDLDGRPPSDDNEVLDALLWIPRVLTSPLYVVSEYVLRQPLRALFTALEREGVLEVLFASGGDFGVLPTAFYEFGLSPSFGLFAFVDHWPFEENRLSVHAATFGADWLRLIVRDRAKLSRRMDLALRLELGRRPDQLVEGIGYDATQAPRARFGAERVEARAELSYQFFGRSALSYQAGYRAVGFEDAGWAGGPSVREVERADALPGYDSGYELTFFRAELQLDSNDPAHELSGARVRLRLLAEYDLAFGGLTATAPDASLVSWVRWGGELAGATDFLGRGRTFMLRIRTALVSPLDDTGRIPFYELPDAGGEGPLPGFVTGQLRGQSTVGLTLEYVWPVYAFLDGSLHVTVGNAFGVHYEGFDWDRLRLSWGVGLVPRFAGEHLVELSFDVGTETFARGAEVTTARIVVGARHGL